MPIMIKLTMKYGDEIWINAGSIRTMQRVKWDRDGTTEIQTDGSGTLHVAETPEEIHMIIEEEIRNIGYLTRGTKS